ncbi:MAG: N-acetyltransferase [Alphaproteobacteria bacterium]|nr:N-acetyltransferase [Alphaproteobacteria bacterium]MCB9929247.1 N-acetyltransferase [Alphaproteobacteria bacterium]
MVAILPTAPAHSARIQDLLDRSFGPNRHAKTSYRFRDGVDEVASLARVALYEGRLIGSIQYWPMLLEGETVLLLGPLAVEPDWANRGIGRALVAASLAAAAAEDWRHVFLVGDFDYYRRFGFLPASNWGVSMPNEQQHRLLARCIGDALPPAAGTLQPTASSSASISAAAALPR